MGLARLASVGVGRLRDGGEIDRAEIAHKARVGDTKADLRRSPWVVVFLSAQDVAEGIADGDEVTDDPGVFGRDSIGSLAVADRDGDGGAIDDLEKRVVFEDVAAFLDGCPFRGGADLEFGCAGRRAGVCSDGGFWMPAGRRWMAPSRSSSMPLCACGRQV